MSRRNRKKQREEAAARGAAERANGGETAPPVWKPPASLTPRRLAFALLWAEAEPGDRLQDIARRAGYSESVSKNGFVAEMCRDPAIREARDHRLQELQRASRVTVEDTLVGLQALAKDPRVPARDRVAALKTILAWYAADKGQHKGGGSKAGDTADGIDDALTKALELQLGIPAEEPAT